MSLGQRLRAVRAEARDDRLPLLAAGVAFFALLALVPALSAVVAGYGLLTDPTEVARQVANLSNPLPPDVRRVVVRQLEDQAARSSGSLGVQAALSLLLSVWSASAGVRWIMVALTDVYDEAERRRPVVIRLIALALTLGALLGVGIILALLAGSTVVASWLGGSRALEVALVVLRWPILIGASLCGLAVLYRFGPSRTDAPWRWITWGSAVGTGVVVVASVGLAVLTSSGVGAAGGYRALGAVAVLAVWLWLVALGVLIGAETDAVLEAEAAGRLSGGDRSP